jgi:DNA polymerase epsilon subunit 2
MLEIVAIGQPPCETRETARLVTCLPLAASRERSDNCRSIYGHIDFLGKGATSLAEDVRHFFLQRPWCDRQLSH